MKILNFMGRFWEVFVLIIAHIALVTQQLLKTYFQHFRKVGFQFEMWGSLMVV